MENIKIGRYAKRIIDYCRVVKLNKIGYGANMVNYCGEEISPENCMLIATRK